MTCVWWWMTNRCVRRDGGIPATHNEKSPHHAAKSPAKLASIPWRRIIHSTCVVQNTARCVLIPDSPNGWVRYRVQVAARTRRKRVSLAVSNTHFHVLVYEIEPNRSKHKQNTNPSQKTLLRA